MSVNINFENNSNRVLGESERKQFKILTAIGLKAVSIWQKIITIKKVIDMGGFKGSTTHEVDGDSVIIGARVDYAQNLELGTSRMPARPTLTPTITEYGEAYSTIAKQIWEQ